MTDITWGEPIEVNGVRPDWLAEDAQCMIWCKGRHDWVGMADRAAAWLWPLVATIRLPADHWAYPVIAKGFTPWAGGENAPEDWDWKGVLGRHGAWIAADGIWRWNHEGDGADIIGYHKARVETSGYAEAVEDGISSNDAAEAYKIAQEYGVMPGAILAAIKRGRELERGK